MIPAGQEQRREPRNTPRRLMTEPRLRPGTSRDGQSSDRLSRFLALVLRHKPESVGITLDPTGFVEIGILAKSVAAQPGWGWVTEDAIRTLVRQDQRRYEIDGDRIHARYGHSIPIEAPGKPVLPPEWLYHGTSPEAFAAIQSEGLRPQGRQFVHLSVTRQDALAVGRRHSPEAQVITVLARRAHEEGCTFYQASPSIYLVRELLPRYLVFPREEG